LLNSNNEYCVEQGCPASLCKTLKTERWNSTPLSRYSRKTVLHLGPIYGTIWTGIF